MSTKTHWSMLVCVMCCGILAHADVKLPAFISSHMVVQRDMRARIWGWAEPGEKVTVSMAGQAKTATTGHDGRWVVRLDPLAAGGPHKLTVAGKNTVTVDDVLVGEVWLCSGQSNMAVTVGRALNPDQEAAAAGHPQIRMFTVAAAAAAQPQRECNGGWKVCSPQTVKSFSATAYFFGRDLHQHLRVPVGLINSSVGGTRIEAWTSKASLIGLEWGRKLFDEVQQQAAAWDPKVAQARYDRAMQTWHEKYAKFRKAKQAGKAKGRGPRKPRFAVHPAKNRKAPSALYNGKIAPLVPYAIRGAIWYQGERNTQSMDAAYEYRRLLPALVRDWRGIWGQGEFPFLWVQLPNYKGRGPNVWPIIRESMLKALATPNTAMAVTIDVGDLRDIHPKNKQAVGARLALAARRVAYGERVVHSGPIYRSMQAQASRLVLSFDCVGSGLVAQAPEQPTKDAPPTGFTVAGEDRRFVPAQAAIDRDKVIVWSDRVMKPAAARYAWADDPKCNLYNKEGLPASPFRTDEWPMRPVEPAASKQ